MLLRNLRKIYATVEIHLYRGHVGPDYMSRAGPVRRAASLCRDDFQPGITWGESARLMADAMNRFWGEEGSSRSIYYGGKLYFQNGHYKNAANDRNCLFPAAGCIIFCIHAVTWTFIFVSSI